MNDNNENHGFAEAFGRSVMNEPHIDLRKLADQTYTLAILLEYSSKGMASKDDIRSKAERLMREFGNLGTIINTNINRLNNEGLTQADITLFKAVLGAQLHSLSTKIKKSYVISSWDAILDYLHVACAYNETEQFRVLFLDRKNVLITDELLSTGTIDHVPVYPREVVKRALDLNASAIILVHNHPAGDVTPSEADIEMTSRIINACEAIDITVHDHIIVGKNSEPLSMRSDGYLSNLTP